LWNTAKSVFRNGTWKTVSNSMENAIASGKDTALRRGVKSTADLLGGHTTGYGVGGLASKGLAAYGMANMIPGLDLPGGDLAMNVSMPILGAAFSAPHVISSMRANSAAGRKAIADDVNIGSQTAINHFMTGLDADPSMVQEQGGYRRFMEGNGIDFSGADSYRQNKYTNPLSKWERLQSFMGDSQKAIDNGSRRMVQDQFNKSAGIGSIASAVGSKLVGAGSKAFKYGVPAMATYGVYDAVTRDKPHDEQAAQQEGYNATQAAIEKKMDGMGNWERFALKMDPTLAASKLEETSPGSIERWENSTGKQFQPGLISSTVNAWKTGGTPSFYEYDAGGNRHYI
jgi:hypothetical protein